MDSQQISGEQGTRAPAREDGALVGVVLAGGESRRMGRDKALLPLPGGRDSAGDGQSPDDDLVTWTARRLARVSDDVVVADRGRRLVAGRLSVEDGPGKGPIAGILGAAREFPGRRLLTLACDLPRVPVDFLRHLISIDGDWVVPVSEEGRLEPLASVFGPLALEKLEARARRGEWAVRDLERVPELQIQRVDPRAWSQESSKEIFTNINKPKDYDQFAAMRQNRLRQRSTSR